MKKEKRVSKSTVTGILVVVVAVIVASIIAKLSIAVIPAGYVGVQYNMNAGDEGQTTLDAFLDNIKEEIRTRVLRETVVEEDEKKKD